jgi:phospholipase/lecithinase/hemolysin
MRYLLRFAALIVTSALSTGASAGYSSLFIFGDSLSDTGNNAFVFDLVGASQGIPLGTLRTPVPTANNSFIPDFPYATSVGGRYSNGPVWAESFAAALGLSATASNLGGTNFAYGGAVAGPLGNPNPFVNFPANFPLSLTTQAATFFGQNPQAPADALYIVAGGGNDARAIITQASTDIFNGVNPFPAIIAGAQAYAAYVDGIVENLELAGAQSILVWDTPNAGLAPAILANGPQAAALATQISELMNAELFKLLADDIAGGTKLFDTFGFITGIAANPSAYGLVNASDACSAAANIDACQQANLQYFFWDGIHPTAAGHQLLAAAVLQAVPEPASFALVCVALICVGISRRSKP